MNAYKKKMSGLAVAALVLAIVFWPAGLVVSIIALRRLQRGRRGRLLAVAGLVISGLAALLTILSLVGVIALFGGGDGGSDDDDSPDAGDVEEEKPQEGAVSVFDMKKGDCVDDVDDATIFVKAAACAKPHGGQVYTLIALPAGDYPGDKFLEGKARRGCAARMRRELPAANVDREVGIFYFLPSQKAWESGERSIPCLAGFKKPRRDTLLPKKT